MASANGDVEHMLATRTATPIAQLDPDLSDQPIRKVHGEVTITWPYSSVSKSVAFLLAEPDFRLRRDKGQVRIQLNGPSAEAIGDLELGSGDEVTLALDGVEWARDEEPARPPGSRSDWQLKFVGKLALKVTLGESQETKFIHIDQPVPTEPEEVFEPIPYAEIDTTLFDDEPVTQNNARPIGNEYASPIFMKRSRASYAPLFEFDLDEEIEEDGGRRGKGRKRPRYSVQNGRWRYREESSSPDPEILLDSSSPAPEQDDDVVMRDTPSKPQMTDGACQTVELELPPPPQSVGNTPSKTFRRTESSSPFLGGSLSEKPSGATTDTGVQASTLSLEPVAPIQPLPATMAEPATANPFGLASGSSGFSQLNPSIQAGFGISPNLPPSHAHGDQQTQPPLPLGGDTVPKQPILGQPTSSQSVFGQPVFGQSDFGQTPGFGAEFGQPSNVSAEFGVIGGSSVDSVRFGFGERPQSTFSGLPYASSQMPMTHHDTHHLSVAYPDPQQPSVHASSPSHRSSEQSSHHSQYHEPLNEPSNYAAGSQTGNNEAPIWPVGSQSSGPWHASSRVDIPEEQHSENSVWTGTPPGMIPPEVEDGTRNRDEMRQQGILSQPVFEQDVPRDALPHGRESSADEDEDSMDSDEQADYDEEEKGDDYDMRNYDRISDDDEDADVERGQPLPDEDLLDEDEDFDEDEEDYDEDEYEEDDYTEGNVYQQPMMRPAPPPQVQKQPIVIDLLSDSDDDEEPAPPPPQNQFGRQQMDGIAKSEPEGNREVPLAAGRQVFGLQSRQRPVEAEQEPDLDEESVEEEEDEAFDEQEESVSGDEQLVHEDRNSESESGETGGEGSDKDVDEPMSAGVGEGAKPNGNIEVAKGTNFSVPEGEEAATSLGPSRGQNEKDLELSVEEGNRQGDPVAEMMGQVQQRTDQVVDNEVDAMSVDAPEHEDVVEPPQPESMELAANFEKPSEDLAASFETQIMDTTTADLPSSPPDQAPSSGTRIDAFHAHPVDSNPSFLTQSGDTAASFQSQALETATSLDLPFSPRRQEPSQEAKEDISMEHGQPGATDEDRSSGSEKHIHEGKTDENAMEQPSDRELELSDKVPRNEDASEMDRLPNVQNETSESKSFEGFSDAQQDAPPSPPESQHQDAHNTISMDISMTTVSSHLETQVTDQEAVTFRTQETEIMLSQPDLVEEEDEMSVTNEKAAKTAEDVALTGEELESDAESVKNGRAVSHDEDLAMSEAVSEPLENEIIAVSSPAQPAETEGPGLSETTGAIDKEAAPALSDEEDFHDASELLQMEASPSVAHFDDRASFVTANSQASEPRETEEAESPSVRKSKRTLRLRALREEPSILFAKPPRGAKRGQRIPSDQSPSPRTTRSQTMSFQKATSPPQDQEDMFARAGLRSPSRRKVSATSANKTKNNLVKRLGTEMPECAPLKDLKSYNMNTLDVAAVVTSTNTDPQRTKARQYVSSFTITDPSTAPQGVIEVSLFRAHKDYLPVVKPGDSILLRRFTVTSLPDRGFGLRTEDESSWAVFDTDGEDAAPQVRGPPVELSETEKSYLIDLRAWYAALDEGPKGTLAAAVGEMVQKGKESRGEK
ncbi:hypothetical protein J7T55_004479 [Diaporthe amygdali]|uniref:uncharacterized protein n=1 Tax=Phomopsis amygdali TaxID=1214568 RepID=UPI0022FF3D85|nr:uncharacterized protein J7T55_004479 [Diaporthe amygdali]KAJ0114738.1 hypothetical protein J7T55_004479 [Diaporthe amygdali]